MKETINLRKQNDREPEAESSKLDGWRDDEEFLSMDSPIQINWTGPLYAHVANPRFLGLFATFIYAVAVVFIFFYKNIFASIFFISSASFLIINSKKLAPEIDFSIGPLSIKIGPREYMFKEIKSFWIEYNPQGIKELSIQLKKWYSMYIRIPINDQDPVQIRLLLLKFIPEVEHEDSLLNAIERGLGF